MLGPDLIPHEPDRAHALALRLEPERVGRQRRDADAVAHPVRCGGDVERRGDAVLGDDAAVLEHERRAERAEVVEQDAVGAVARRDRAHPRQAVAERRMQRRQQQRVLGRDALGDRDAAHLVDVALAQQQVGLAVVGAERAALGPVVAHERQQVAQVARVRGLAQQHPGALAALLERLGQRRRLVVGRDARGEVGIELRPVDARRVPVDALARVPARSSRARPARRRSRPGSSSSRPGPSTRSRARIPARSASESGARGDSNGLAGTHAGASASTSIGSPSQASRNQCTPSGPSALASSCGSHTIVVVPRATSNRASSPTISLDDSTCMCASMNPAAQPAPAPVDARPARRSDPTPAKRPSAIATSPSSHSLVNAPKT